MHRCAVCGQPAAQVCTRCHVVSYCSKACQAAAWPAHRELCKKQNIVPDIEDLVTNDLRELRQASRHCDCPKCRQSCHRTPGYYDPDHVLLLEQQWVADNPDRPPADFWTGFVEDYYSESGEDYFFLRPATTGETPGVQVPFFPDLQPCARLGPAGCTLSRAKMPLGCVTALCCGDGASSITKRHARAIWSTASGVRVLKKFREAARARGDSDLVGPGLPTGDLESASEYLDPDQLTTLTTATMVAAGLPPDSDERHKLSMMSAIITGTLRDACLRETGKRRRRAFKP